MKKILLLWFLFFGIYPTINQNTISFTTTQVCYAQDCPNNVNDPVVRESIWGWLRNLWKAISGVASSIYDFLDDFFSTSGGNSPPPSGNTPTSIPDLPTTWAVTFYGSATSVPQSPVFSGGGGGGYTANPAVHNIITEEFPDPDPPVNDCEGINNGTAFIDDCGTCVGGYTGLIPCYIPPPDCNGVPGGTAYRDSCNICVGGNTGKLPCLKDCNNVWGGSAYPDGCSICAGGNTGIVPCDTVSVIKVICDTFAIINNNKTTLIIDSLNTQLKMVALRNNVHADVENGLAAYDSSGSYKVFNAASTNNTVLSASVPIVDTSTGPNRKNIVATVHTHNDYADALPDNGDIYNLIFGRHFANKSLFRSYIVSAEAGTDLAIVVTDTMKALQFINLYPQDSAIYYSDTAILINPTTGDTIRQPLNPSWANFYGNFGQDSISMSDEFNNSVKILRRNHYNEVYLFTYAQVYMLERYNMGVKILVKINGVFKELSPLITRDSINGKLLTLKIKICQ